MRLTQILMACLFVPSISFGQFTKVVNSELSPVYKSQVFEIDFEALESILSQCESSDIQLKSSVSILLPDPDGSDLKLFIEYAPILAPALREKYPEIKSYKVSGNGNYGRIGRTYKGFHGMIFTPKGTVYIDPIPNSNHYHSYYRSDYKEHFNSKRDHHCLVEEKTTEQQEVNLKSSTASRGKRSGETLRTYRLALACTGEYASFHGGTVSGVLSAMAVTMNRVNGIYERDFAVTMEIIGNNDTLVFLNAGTDPYTNNSGFNMLGQNQTTVNARIGSANYDIGHVFSTGGGGIASLASVCNFSNKAQGVTGGGSPVGDAFDIDYVAHEMGHQFGGNHTQNNSCNRVQSAAYEPGSASTIMGYAGICPPNLQNHSDDYFHSHNYDEIITNVETGTGSLCPTETPTNNTPPTVFAGDEGFHIPAETPFLLVGEGSDSEGDDILYCWEEMDLGPSGHPQSPVLNAPIFRSWLPTESPERTCPKLSSVISGNLVMGETYADYSRDLTFRLTLRDQNAAGGGVSYDEIAFDVDGNSGPFVVNTPTSGENIAAGSTYTVEWDVANTDQSPVNCQLVNIELCTVSNGSLEVLQMLAEETSNDGSEDIAISSLHVGNGRYIRVMASNNIFFNINGGEFNVTPPVELETFGIPLTATPDYNTSTVALNWVDSFPNETAFMIERSLGGNFNFSLIDSVGANVTTYTDLGAVMTGNNFYRVYAKNNISVSSYSNEATYAPLGLDQEAINAVKLYPNPADNQLVLELPNELINSDFEIIDISGRSLLKGHLDASRTVLDLSALPQGVYNLFIKSVKIKGPVIFQVIH